MDRASTPGTPNLMPLVASRLVRTSEPEQGAQWQEGLIKELTGGDPVEVRGMGDWIDPVAALRDAAARPLVRKSRTRK